MAKTYENNVDSILHLTSLAQICRPTDSNTIRSSTVIFEYCRQTLGDMNPLDSIAHHIRINLQVLILDPSINRRHLQSYFLKLLLFSALFT